jgi:hypothetical protein
VKVIAPTPLVADAADILGDFHETVVVVGAAAIEVALSDAEIAITPTRDVDVLVPADDADAIVAALEASGMVRSEIPHERSFTWVRGDLKVQLVRSYHPFPPGAARQLPGNPAFGMANNPMSQVEVAFGDAPQMARLRCANAACLLALKQAAFGRRRAESDVPVRRDYHDAYLLIDAARSDVVCEWRRAGREVQRRGRGAIEALAAGGAVTMAAADEMVRLGQADTPRRAENRVRRAATMILRELDAG